VAGVLAVALAGMGQAGIIRPGQRRPPQPPANAANEVPPEAARTAIMAAEDRRLPLPDDLHTPAIDTLREQQADDVLLLIRLARATNLGTRSRAIRALGRYQRRELTQDLELVMASQTISGETMNAVAESLRGPAIDPDMSLDQIARVFRPEYLGAVDPARDAWFATLPALARSIARLPYSSVAQVQVADDFFVKSIESVQSDPRYWAIMAPIAQAAESRARLHTKFGPPSEELTTWLRRMATGIPRSYPGKVDAMEALVTSRGVDVETLRIAANDDKSPAMRRLAAASIGGTGSPLAPAERTDTLVRLLNDSNSQVRLEAVRAWARRETTTNGCQRLLDAIRDPSVPVVLMVFDVLGDQCKTDINVTDRLTVEARIPHPIEWHKASHALVSLAKRAPDRVAIIMQNHLASTTWQVRMYAARAAAITNDVVALERLAMDPVDNVREAALPALRRLKKAESDLQFLAALNRHDYQLLRTASRELKGSRSTPEIAGALGDALKRVTADKKETSRDVRLELLDRLRELGSEDQAGAVAPLLQDFDIEVAQSAAATLALWTEKPQEILPILLPRPPLPTAGELAEAASVPAHVKLRSGKVFRIRLRPDTAPLNATRFLRLARAGYYDGLTIHRVVPNFIIQGGSPGANEYVGDGPYVKDEFSLLHHSAGAVGMSTRGRDTGDGQFFINLVSNPRLDFDYTVFGHVIGGADVLAEILEGDVIESIVFQKEADEKPPVESRPR
jgi:cyclophilin family peptidyl-prolyl cis-trans isomerase/HEAT repeat protein